MPAFKDSQFDYLFSAIADKYPAIGQDTESTQFQFTGSPMDADWLKGNDIAAYNAADRVSADVNGFYTPNPGALYQDYLSLIISISGGEDLEKDPLYQQLINQKNIAEKNYKAALNQLTVAWTSYKEQNINPNTGAPEMSYSEWQNSPIGGLQYYTDVNKYENQIKELSDRIKRVVKPFNAALAEAQDQATAKSNTSNYTKKDGSSVKLPTITVEGDLGEDLTTWSSQRDSYDLDVTLDKNSTVKTPWKTVYRTKVEQHCLSTSVKTNVNTSRIIQDKHYKLRVMIKGLKSYPVSFGNWYTSSFVNPETAKFSPATAVNAETFFAADNGSLHMIPSQIWVMYQPKIELTVSTDLYRQEIEWALKSGVNWLSILTLNVDASAGTSLAKVGEETTTITFDSPPSQGPQIFGVTSIKRILASSIEKNKEKEEEVVV